MKKLLLMGCLMVFIFCAPKKSTVETEGIEEVIVFGEEEDISVSHEPVMPQPAEEEAVAPPVHEEEPAMPPVTEEEVTVIPPPVVEEEPVIPMPPVKEAPPVVSVEPPMPPAPQAPTKVLGFRIQIFASSTEKNASRVADDARAALGENVYVDHIAPYYKVRVGNCLTREEAEGLRKSALNQGYAGAFIVETMIIP